MTSLVVNVTDTQHEDSSSNRSFRTDFAHPVLYQTLAVRLLIRDDSHCAVWQKISNRWLLSTINGLTKLPLEVDLYGDSSSSSSDSYPGVWDILWKAPVAKLVTDPEPRSCSGPAEEESSLPIPTVEVASDCRWCCFNWLGELVSPDERLAELLRLEDTWNVLVGFDQIFSSPNTHSLCSKEYKNLSFHKL